MATQAEMPQVQLSLWVDSPPVGVLFAVQRGKADLLPPAAVEPAALQFRLALRIGKPLASGLVNFLGEYTQGPPDERFVYINSGKRAGQPEVYWDRRAKLKLASIPVDLVAAAMSDPDRLIETRIHGTMKDGGPVCASIASAQLHWRLR